MSVHGVKQTNRAIGTQRLLSSFNNLVPLHLKINRLLIKEASVNLLTWAATTKHVYLKLTFCCQILFFITLQHVGGFHGVISAFNLWMAMMDFLTTIINVHHESAYTLWIKRKCIYITKSKRKYIYITYEEKW